MLKLEWSQNDLGQPDRMLYLQDLFVGEVHEYERSPHRPWRAWKMDVPEGSHLGLFEKIEDARKAVEDWAKAQLGIE